MSWIRTRTDEAETAAPTIAADPSPMRDMPARDSRQAVAAPAPAPAGASAQIGKSICIEGTVTGNESLTIDGKVKGRVELHGHALIVGANGRIEADVSAKSVSVQGEVKGNIDCEDRVQVGASGSVTGDLRAPRIVLEDGASFSGRVETTTK